MKPEEPEVLGLLALMELQCSRLLARQDRQGLPVPLDRQDRGLWDRLLIRRGLEIVERACRMSSPTGWYLLQALISACHARAASFRDTNWREILARYDALFLLSPTYVVALNRAVAVSWAMNPAAGMAVLKAIEDEWDVETYPLFHATRADFLSRLGFQDQAAAAYQAAAVLSTNLPQKLFLVTRAEECLAGSRTDVG
ncbi:MULTISPECIES: DUF6596 domain-containing protein [Gammaproteobacteria]|uniref:DUF6596 domain-containing protein n=1 Tax=Gammaproteobacteria TaxID=1236 RepID=UPI002795DD51|nr:MULTISPECIES: DUF6596 domain-containing protein [Gammaproteobacteria]MDW1236826.1 DUF6596 domain-containing protein [Klebsiella pneumoniae]MDW1262948.1 DUF6596 domain-containing protein [Klebsiella pneumoniae]MDW1350925.1 DUF6596 domain-containing protein [Klebsiella pneumoniae]MDW1387498.1 DUF6596 domain-containing protein [Klebsiella pneumoniae]MDW1434319.1 DUF6596 domain-containing protein [Klebsiella pneumoniae]